ncbi:hypothetical protein [Georgenia subflava]|uniref:Uncharacterized protein n=1 Tax=Georgenia subflava TaxID=1622177 RepID=A0A6N7ENC9_9MICO|nr:hypothetical protein [Georgenia subflava]MPV38628.1 hypothetical protein [Georgenia subflava]
MTTAVPRVLIHRLPADVEETITTLGAMPTRCSVSADIVVSNGPAPETPEVDTLQIGGAIGLPARGGWYTEEPVMTPRWDVALGAELMGLSALARATLLTDPPGSGQRWCGPRPVPDWFLGTTPLVSSDSGHHAAMVLRRPCGAKLWWVSGATLDYLPWVEVFLEHTLDHADVTEAVTA